MKGCFFCSLEKSPWYIPAKYAETNNMKNENEKYKNINEKYISYIHFGINFFIPEKFLFSHNFHNLSFSADSKNNLLAEKEKKNPNEPILLFIHAGLPNMNGNMSRKIECTYINQNM